MSDIELAWATGFFEGEGTVGSYKTLRDGSPYPRIAVTQNGDYAPQLLQRFVDALGDGEVSGPYDYRAQHKNTKTLRYTVQLYGVRAERAMEVMRPHFTVGSAKVAKYDEVMGRGSTE